MRILFKTPHQKIFRRCFFVKSYETVKDERGLVMIVKHGLNKETHIPLLGTILRFVGKDA